MTRDLLAAIRNGGAVEVEAIVAAVGATLRSQSLDPAFKADAIALPSESLLIEKLDAADPARVHEVREEVRRAIGTRLARGPPARLHGGERSRPGQSVGRGQGPAPAARGDAGADRGGRADARREPCAAAI